MLVVAAYESRGVSHSVLESATFDNAQQVQVAQRTRDVGIRMALGAQAPQVWWLIAKRAFVQLAAGTVIEAELETRT